MQHKCFQLCWTLLYGRIILTTLICVTFTSGFLLGCTNKFSGAVNVSLWLLNWQTAYLHLAGSWICDHVNSSAAWLLFIHCLFFVRVHPVLSLDELCFSLQRAVFWNKFIAWWLHACCSFGVHLVRLVHCVYCLLLCLGNDESTVSQHILLEPTCNSWLGIFYRVERW